MAIKILDGIVASRIAAGEVVENPASVLRELLDNSADALSSKITVSIEEGGVKLLCVTDNGRGFEKEDLPLAFASHATSKISTLEDLFNLHTFGFRGEALYSICSVSKLTISSNGYSITCDNGKTTSVVKSHIEKGTEVKCEDLFENIPARKQFLKRNSTEALECKKVFLEKALALENIEFTFINEGKVELKLEACDKKKRCLDIMSLDRSFVKSDTLEMTADADPIKLYAVCSNPGVYKRDRSQIKILINNRVVDSYAFVKAVTDSYSVSLPGGAFPFFYLFIEDSPSLVDFNIHPSKRECKLRNQSTIYGLLVKMIRDCLLKNSQREMPESTAAPVQKEIKFEQAEKLTEYKLPEVEKNKITLSESWFESAREILAKKETKPGKIATYKHYTYLGQVFNTFLVCSDKERVFFIDQHAAHERIIFDEIKALKDIQKLMIPYEFETERNVDDFLLENSVLYQDMGIELVRKSDLVWEIVSLPAICRKTESYIASFIQKSCGDPESIKKALFAVISCHCAVKAGDILDRITAEKILDGAFSLDAMLCPHGRSFVWTISKEDLFKFVGRTL